MPRCALALLVVAAAALAACRKPAPERSLPDTFDASDEHDEPERKPPPRTLAPRLGLGDPDHLPLVLPEAPPPLTSNAPPIAARYQGTITSSPTSVGAFAPGESRHLWIHFHAAARGATPAAIRTIRVAGFDGVSAGFETELEVWDPSYGVGDLVRDTLDLPFALLRAVRSKKADDPPFSLTLPARQKAYSTLVVVASLDAKPGHQKGRIELEGNFDPISLPLELDVVPFADRVGAALASLDAPEVELRIAKLVPRPARGQEGDPVDVPTPARPRPGGAWRRWLVAGDGIWDLGTAAWLGPVTVEEKKNHLGDRFLAGPRDTPRLFVVNDPSVDVIDVRTRTTIARLVSDRGDFEHILSVSPDGDRVLAQTSMRMHAFSQVGGEWKEQVVDDPDLGRQNTFFVSVDADARYALAGVRPDRFGWGWDKLVRYDLATGEKKSVTLDTCVLWHVGRGLVVGLVDGRAEKETVEIRLVRIDDLSVTKISLPPVDDRVRELDVDDATGDVFGGTFVHGCIAFSTKTLKQHPCAGMPHLEAKVPGTGIAYRLDSDGVRYHR